MTPSRSGFDRPLPRLLAGIAPVDARASHIILSAMSRIGASLGVAPCA